MAGGGRQTALPAGDAERPLHPGDAAGAPEAPHRPHAYQSLLRHHQIDKVYEAIAALRPELDWPLRRLSRLQESAAHFMAMEEVEGEPNADTLIEPIEVLGDAWARYRLSPRTGQKHQLRAHLC